MNSPGERLRAERIRLELSQTEFGELIGVRRLAQSNYESDARSPDLLYLQAAMRVGVDVLYVISGKHEESALSPDEQELIQRFRAAPLAVKAAVIGALTTGATFTEQPSAKPGETQVKIGGVHAGGSINVGRNMRAGDVSSQSTAKTSKKTSSVKAPQRKGR